MSVTKIHTLLLIIFLYSSLNSRIIQEIKTTNIDINTLAMQKYYRAIELAYDGEYTSALENFNFTNKYIPTFTNAYIFKQILTDYNNGVVSEDLIKDIFELYLDDRDFLNDKRTSSLVKLLNEYSDYYYLYLLYAELAKHTVNTSLMLQNYNKAINTSPDNYIGYYLRAILYKESGDTDSSLADFLRTIVLNPEYGPALFETGILYNHNRNYTQAIIHFEKAIQKWPVIQKKQIIYEAYNNRGALFLQQKKYNEALADFNRAIELNAEWQESYLNKGIALKFLKNYTDALASFTFLLQKNDHHEQAYYHRGLTYMELGNHDLAIDDIGTALAINPNEIKYAYSLADCYFKNKEYQLALNYFNKVIDKSDVNYWAYYWKAFSLEKLERYREAISAYQSFVDNSTEKEYEHQLYAVKRISRLKKWLNR